MELGGLEFEALGPEPRAGALQRPFPMASAGTSAPRFRPARAGGDGLSDLARRFLELGASDPRGRGARARHQGGRRNHGMLPSGLGEARSRISEERIMTSYDEDFFQWTLENARLLRQGQWAEIDADNIAEELESMGKSDKREINGRLAVLVAHLLKYQHQPSLRSRSRTRTIDTQRDGIKDLLADSPSLIHKMDWVESYKRGRRNASRDMGVAVDFFPAECPYSPEEVLDDAFWPSPGNRAN